MTWGEFKAAIEGLGVRDADEIDTIIDGTCTEAVFKTTDIRTAPPYFDWLTPEQAAAYPGPRRVLIEYNEPLTEKRATRRP